MNGNHNKFNKNIHRALTGPEAQDPSLEISFRGVLMFTMNPDCYTTRFSTDYQSSLRRNVPISFLTRLVSVAALFECYLRVTIALPFDQIA